ncbi:hypothetical protein T484DRAFT_1621847 [Baffinella frigidus]|nr:hypothetical protein T484DRAFT_1621847 [Cryptophyta sp. CCMP2293]
MAVDDAVKDDSSIVSLHPKTMEELQFSGGDFVQLKGRMGVDTICIVLPDESCEEGKIRMNQVVRQNLRVHLGDIVIVSPCPDVENGTRVHVLPIANTVAGFTGGDLFEHFLTPYFGEAEAECHFRPVRKGDIFLVRGATRSIEFKVVDTEPGDYCIVSPDTLIVCEGSPVEREVEGTVAERASAAAQLMSEGRLLRKT